MVRRFALSFSKTPLLCVIDVFHPENNRGHLIIASSFSQWNKKNKAQFDAAGIELR
jgi:hypothetical protein